MDSQMPFSEVESLIEALNVGDVPAALKAMEEDDTEAAATPSVTDLPDAFVTGSALLQFDETVPEALRSAVALSLLAAQRVAANDESVTTPQEWLEAHNNVLSNLNWMVEHAGFEKKTFDGDDIEVHKAILPFLATALGGASAMVLIRSALDQLAEMDENTPWIKLFSREAVRFQVSEFHFGVVSSDATTTRINLAAARFDASYQLTQVLFFKITNQNAAFELANGTLSADNSHLTAINTPLKTRLLDHAVSYIRSLDI